MLKMYKFKANEILALDGLHKVQCPKDKPMLVPEPLASQLLEQGRIVQADADTSGYETKATTPEVKKKASAVEPKKAKKKATKKKKG